MDHITPQIVEVSIEVDVTTGNVRLWFVDPNPTPIGESAFVEFTAISGWPIILEILRQVERSGDANRYVRYHVRAIKG